MREVITRIVKLIVRPIRYTKVMEFIEEQFEVESYDKVTSRHFEYPFGVAETVKLARKNKNAKILDCGSFGSFYGPILARLGLDVTGVDIVNWSVKIPGLKSITADLKSLPFKDNTYDICAVISTIEHCGLPRFGENVDIDGDYKAFDEIYRVTKKRGFIVFTAPFAGEYYIHSNKHRIYDIKRFNKMTRKTTLIKKEFYAAIKDPRVFEPVTFSEVKKIIPSLKGEHGIICAILQK